MKAEFFVLLDLDGVVCRWPYQQVADWAGKAALLQWLDDQRRGGVEFHFIPVTNRPAGHLQYVCYDWRFPEGVCIAESGATVYYPDNNTQAVNPRFESFRLTWRPRIAAAIAEQLDFGLGARFQDEPAGRLVTLEVIARNRWADLAYLEERIPVILQPFAEQVRWELGKSVVIYPKDCDKTAGVERLHVLYDEYFGCGTFSWKRSLWIADGRRDITAAQLVHCRGGQVAAVGGSHDDYVAVIRQLNGVVATATYERGMLEVLQQFLARS